MHWLIRLGIVALFLYTAYLYASIITMHFSR